MANTGNTQQIINYGATSNDGQGDPLRTAFIKTDENFNNIWLAGPVGSNITITNNIIGVQNTNGNLTLAPNGVGVIESRNSVLPWVDSVYDLGGPNNYWRNIYVSGISTGNLSIDGDLSVGGNITVAGNIIEMGNIVTDIFVLHLANTATTDAQANGAGIVVGANSNIATMLYDAPDNRWYFNVGISAAGNVGGTNLRTRGSVLAGQEITAIGNIVSFGNITGNLRVPGAAGQILYNRNGIAGVSPTDFNYDESTQTLYVHTGTFEGETDGHNALYAGTAGAAYLGSAVMAQFTGNVDNYSQINFQNISTSPIASGDYIITADNGNDFYYYLNLGMTGSNWDGSQTNGLGDKIGPNQGYLYVKDGNLAIGTLTDSGSSVWTFDNIGGLTIPGAINLPSGEISSPFGPGPTILANTDAATNPGFFSALITANTNQSLAVMATVSYGGNTGTGFIGTSDETGNSHNWYFQPDGRTVFPEFTLPNVDGLAGQAFVTDGSGSVTWANVSYYANSNAASFLANFGSNTISTSGNITAGNFIGSGANVELVAGTNTWTFDDTGNMTTSGNLKLVSNSNLWNFDTNGTLTLPGNTLQLGLIAGNTGLRSDNSSITIDTTAAGGGLWTFADDGVLGVPGNIGMMSNWINNLSDPFYAQDAATKNYVDLVAQGLHIHDSCNVATTEDLATYTGATVTYNNGAGGVGATLTFTGNTLVDIDGFSLTAQDRILVKNESNAVFNGIYVYSNNTALTRATDFNTDSAAAGGDFTFVTSGNTFADTGWVQTTDTPSLGNSNIVWQQFSAAGTYSANTDAGLTQTGSVFSAKVDNETTAFDINGNIVVKSGANLTINSLSASGNVTAAYLFGNASQVTGLSGVAYTGDYADLSNVPTNLNQFTNGPGYITSATANVISVNGKTGVVTVTEYSNAAVSAYLANYGSNTISTTGNITSGNLSVTGNISGTIVSPGSNTQILFNDAGTISGNTNLTYNKTTSTLDVNGPIIAGTGSALGGLTNPVISGTGTADNYLQIDLWNGSNTANASTDFIAYPSNGTDATGWIDVGITSNNFSASAYTVTKQNEGYVFMSAVSGSGRSGNLVLATDSTGTSNSIEFYVGGFNQAKDGTGRKLLIASAGANVTGALNVTANITGGNLSVTGNVNGNTNGFAIGYRDIPQVSFAANATISTSDAGKHYYSTSSSNLVLTIANNASQAFSVGAAINIINLGTGNITIAQGSGVTLYFAGNSTSGNRTLASYGAGTIQKVDTNTWFLVGVGVT